VHLNLLQGDSADAEWLLQRLEASAARADPSDPEPNGLRESLRAREALLAHDTIAAIDHLQASLARAPWWISSWAPLSDAAPQRLLLAELLIARGRGREAERWLNSFGNLGVLGDLVYAWRVEELWISMKRTGRRNSSSRTRGRWECA
jgi:hypothetical protein